nr:DUF2946 family protein [Sphingobium boeckii]
MALMMKLLMPAGFMPLVSGGVMTVQICTGMGLQTVAVSIPGMAGETDPPAEQKQADQPCAFAGLWTPSLAAADPIQLALALAFIGLIAFRVVLRPSRSHDTRLRPPLRGPPATA